MSNKNGGMVRAKRRGLNRLKWLRAWLVGLRRCWLRRVWRMDIHHTAQFSLSAKFDKTFPIGVHVGEYSYIAFDARILTHDMIRGLYLHTYIGSNCFVGGRSLILPGVRIGDNCIVAAGSVVTRSVSPFSMVAGNPAKVIRTDIEVGRFGRLLEADANEGELAARGLT